MASLLLMVLACTPTVVGPPAVHTSDVSAAVVHPAAAESDVLVSVGSLHKVCASVADTCTFRLLY